MEVWRQDAANTVGETPTPPQSQALTSSWAGRPRHCRRDAGATNTDCGDTEELLAEFCQKILRVDGLGEDFELVALGARAFQEVGGSGLAGEEQDFAAREETANVDGGLDTVHVGHDDVADDEVGTNGFGALDGAGSGIDSRGIEPVLVEDYGERVGDYSFVVYHQNLGFVVAIGHLELHPFGCYFPAETLLPFRIIAPA